MCFHDASAGGATHMWSESRFQRWVLPHVLFLGRCPRLELSRASALDDTLIALRTAKRLQWSCETFAHGNERA
jgi:hypothetical protein